MDLNISQAKEMQELQSDSRSKGVTIGMLFNNYCMINKEKLAEHTKEQLLKEYLDFRILWEEAKSKPTMDLNKVMKTGGL